MTTISQPPANPAPTPTPPQYATGAIRRNTATLSVAVRTGLPTVDGTLDWIVMTTNYGGYYANWDEIGGTNWTDVTTTKKRKPKT